MLYRIRNRLSKSSHEPKEEEIEEKKMVKFVIVSTHGNDNFERASMAWAVANAAHVLDAEVIMFLQAEGVNVVRKNFCKGWVFPPFTPLETLIETFMEMGGKVYACVPCVEAREIKKEDYIEGVMLAGATKLLAESVDAKVFTY
ncbi:MAG: DsrE family protein [Candidatus Hodarchaeales archaeon]